MRRGEVLAKRKEKRMRYDERKYGKLKTEKRGERQADQRRRPAVKVRNSVGRSIYLYQSQAHV